MSNKDLITLAGLAFMAIAHIASSKVKLINILKTHGWISFGAGASIAYVFVHVLPEIGIFQNQITGHTGGHHQPVSFISQPLYLVTLGGLCFVYLLDTIEARFYIETFKARQRHKYHIHLFSTRTFLYLLYNVMIAFIITQRPGEGLINIMLITIALMLHFIVLNASFQETYEELQDRFIRWFATSGLLIGWLLGIMIEVPVSITATIFSLIGGMITYVALKSELPQTKHKAPFHFLAGAFLYACIALAIPFFGLSHLANH